MQIVSITRQGQVTIPASIRKTLGLNRYPKATVRLEDKKIIIEPIPDLLKLGGILKNKKIKGKSVKEIIKLEEEAIAAAVSKKH